MIPLSKTMHMTDFSHLTGELAAVDQILGILNGGDKAQHPLRRWEYAMAFRAYKEWAFRRMWVAEKTEFRVADHGCCTGMLAPLMYALGNDVRLYEIWAWGNQQEFATWQMEKIKEQAPYERLGTYQWINRPLCQLTEEDRNMDVVFCISTMEHIVPYEEAWRDLCCCVGPKGMLFITSDSAEDEHDHYIANNVRGGRMFNKDVYERLVGWGREEGLELLGGEADWSWDESCRLIPYVGAGPTGYGFACLSMERIHD